MLRDLLKKEGLEIGRCHVATPRILIGSAGGVNCHDRLFFQGEVYLKAYETVSKARVLIDRYLAFYNGQRLHSSLDRQAPDHAYFIRFL